MLAKLEIKGREIVGCWYADARCVPKNVVVALNPYLTYFFVCSWWREEVERAIERQKGSERINNTNMALLLVGYDCQCSQQCIIRTDRG